MERPADTLIATTALERVRHWWRRLAASVLPGRVADEAGHARLLAHVEDLFRDYRSQRGGEASARKRAEQLAALYRASDLDERAAILVLIAQAFVPDRSALDAALGAMQSAANPIEASRAEAQLRLALNMPRAHFLSQFNLLADGVKFLVDLRADLLELLPREPSLEVLKVELDGLLASWFDPGFLELRRITWRSPALVLEKLMRYEAVHPIESWDDLRNRLDTDRRCYAFFHPRLPDEPLIFVEIALVKGLSSSVQALLDERAPARDPHTADTATFYSISNTQRGLRGISFGNLLLKRVIEDLRRDLPQLESFATLSPLPGFRKWLNARAEAAPLAATLARPDWPQDAKLAAELQEPLEKLCARYLLAEKSGNRPLDPVANFHLENGAFLQRIFWLADTSERGMSQSYGLMVSYRYDLPEVDRNHDRFLRDGHIAAASRVRRLVG